MAEATTDDDSGTPDGYTDSDVARWLSLIERAQNDAQAYQKRCDVIRNIYRYKSASNATRRRKYALLYSNIETLRPAVYGRAPKPVVDNRFKSSDPVSLTAAQMLERALNFQFEVCKYHDTFERVTQDFLLYGRGVPRLRYEPIVQEADIEDGLSDAAVEGPQVEAKEDAEDVEPDEILAFEHVFCDFVQRDDFIHPPSRSWSELPWLVYRAFLSREELVKRFPDVGAKIPLDAKPTDGRDRRQDRTDSVEDKATIYEIWDKTKRWVCWVAKGWPKILDESEPYLKLNGFYPSPKPAYGIMTNDSLEPVPDYIEYQDQAEEIDDLTARIASLQDSLKLVGFYPGGPAGEGAPEIEKAVKPGFENRMVAVKNWAVFTEGGRGGAPIIWLPMDQVSKVLEGCVQLRKELIDDVYQITGISDIMRGDTDPDETAAAQGLKQANGGKRIKTRQNEIARLCAEVTQMAGEIISEVFDINTLMKMADMKLHSDADVQMMQQQYALAQQRYQQMQAMAQQQAAQQPQGQPPQGMPPGAQPQPGGPPQGAPTPQISPPPPPPDPGPTQEQVLAILRDNVTRRFRLDIETDSTIGMDEAGEQQRRTSFITEMTQFVVGWAPIIQQQPELAQLAGTLLKFGVRAFPAAREIESEIDKTIDQLIQGASQPKPPPPMDPADQAKIQVANMTMQGKLAQIKQQGDNDMLRHQAEMQQLDVKGQIENTKAQVELENARLEGMQSAQAHSQAMERANFDMQAARELHMQKMIKPEASSQSRDVASNPVGGPVMHPSAGGNPPIHQPSVTVVVPPPQPVHNAAPVHIPEMSR